MSIHVMNRVWRESPAKGSELLLLLAIADFADDDGVAWPGVETLAKKARLSKRQTQYNIRSLVTAGLLQVEENAGPKGTHRYRVLHAAAKLDMHSVCEGCGMTGSDHGPALHRHHVIPRSKGGSNHPDNLITLCAPCHARIHQERDRDSYPLALLRDADTAGCKSSTVQDSSQRGAKSDTKGVQPIAPEPSVEPSKNHQDTSAPKNTNRALADDEALVEVWAQECNGGTWPIEAGAARKHAKKLVKGGFDEDETRELIAWCRDLDWRKSGITMGFLASQADNFRAAVREGRARHKPADAKQGLVWG